jgi:hypothetical protein
MELVITEVELNHEPKDGFDVEMSHNIDMHI